MRLMGKAGESRIEKQDCGNPTVYLPQTYTVIQGQSVVGGEQQSCDKMMPSSMLGKFVGRHP